MCRNCGRPCANVSCLQRTLAAFGSMWNRRVDAHVLAGVSALPATLDSADRRKIHGTYRLKIDAFLQVQHDLGDAILQIVPADCTSVSPPCSWLGTRPITRTAYVVSMSSRTGCEGIPGIAAGAIMMGRESRGSHSGRIRWVGRDAFVEMACWRSKSRQAVPKTDAQVSLSSGHAASAHVPFRGARFAREGSKACETETEAYSKNRRVSQPLVPPQQAAMWGRSGGERECQRSNVARTEQCRKRVLLEMMLGTGRYWMLTLQRRMQKQS